MPSYRYLRCVADVPAHGLRSGDLVEITLGADEPIRSYRTHGHNLGAFLGLEADGQLIPLDGVLGLRPTPQAVAPPRESERRPLGR